MGENTLTIATDYGLGRVYPQFAWSSFPSGVTAQRSLAENY
jgi:hypothetical protein